MRGLRTTLAIAALLGAAAAPAAAQERVGGAADPNTRQAQFHAGVFTDYAGFTAEVGGISTTGTPGPDTKSEANTNIKYDINHVVTGAVIGVHFAPPALPGFAGDLSLVLGSATSSIELDADEGSILVPGGSPLSHNHQTMADRDGDLAFGFLLRLGYLIKGRVFFGLDYQFLTGSGTFNSDVFFNDTVDGDYEFTRHRINLLVGAQTGFARPYVGLGFLMYEANADLTESDDPTGPDTWDVDFEPDDQVRVLLGVEVAQDMIGARFDLVLMPQIGVGVTIFVRV